MKIFLIMAVIFIIEFATAAFVHNQFGIEARTIAIVGIFIGWINAFVYLYLDRNN